MKIDRYLITKMDCPSEEQMIRMKLSEENSIKELQFDIPNRTLHVIHNGDSGSISKVIDSLNFDSRLVESTPWTGTLNEESKDSAALQKKTAIHRSCYKFLLFSA